MVRSILVLSVLCLLLVVSCGEKKADPSKIGEATKLVTNKDFEKGIAMLDGMGKSSPSDEVLKKAQVNAHIMYGNYFMYESTLPPKEKYPSALRQYRMATAIEPTNAEAKQNINLIEGIYNQMGRTVPN
jgi:Flp pilus assembly protein TadD